MMHFLTPGNGRDFLERLSFALLWLAFLLFPVAHLSIGGGIPIYWSESMIGLSVLVLVLNDTRRARDRFIAVFQGEALFFFFTHLFLFGIGLAYLFNPHSLSDWGEIKSFYLVPIILLILILVWGETRNRIESLALSWLLGIVAASLAATVAFFSGWFTYDGRLAGPYLSPNYLAMLVAPGVLLAGYFFIARPGQALYRWGASCVGVLILFTLWGTRSYTAWLAISIALLVGPWLRRASSTLRSWAVISLLLIALVGAAFFAEQGTEKWNSLTSGSERSSLASRLMIWRAATKIAGDSLPWGIGTGNFQAAYLANQPNFPTYLEWAVPTPHNLYLHFLLEGGIAALIGFLGCVYVVMRRVFVYLPERQPVPLLGLAIALVMFYLVYGLADTPYMKNDLALAVWSSLGFGLAALRIRG